MFSESRWADNGGRGKAERVRDVVYDVYCGGTKPGMRGVKTSGWKLIEYDVLDGYVRRTQLFDLTANPDELLAEHHDPALVTLLGNEPRADQLNLADRPERAAKLEELRRLLKTEMERFGDPYELAW